MAILRRRIDLVSITVVLFALGIQLVAFFLPLPWYAWPLVVVPMRWTQLVEHNHAHVPIFRSQLLDEILGWIMFLNGGVPLEGYRVYHVATHHRYADERDWTSPFAYAGAEFPRRPVKRWYYVLTYTFLAFLEVTTRLLRRPGSRALRRYVTSIAVVGAASALLLWIDPARFLLFFGLTWLATYLVGPLVNWRQHVGCSYETPYTESRTNLRWTSRSVGFNGGFHSAHHLRPALHWSELARYHWAEVAPHTPPEYYTPRPPRSAVATRDPIRVG